MKLSKYYEIFEKKVYDHANIVLVVLLTIGFLIRVIYLEQNHLWIDETITGIVSLAILEHGIPLLDSGELYTRALLYSYATALMALLFEGDFGIRILSSIFGVGTIYLGYLYGRDIFNDNHIAIIISAFITFLSIEIIYSMQARFYQMYQFFLFLLIYFLYKEYIKGANYNLTLFHTGVIALLIILINIFIISSLLVVVYFSLIIFKYKKVINKIEKLNCSVIILIVINIFLYLFNNNLVFFVSRINISSLDTIVFLSSAYLYHTLTYFPMIIISCIGFILMCKKRKGISFLLIIAICILSMPLIISNEFATRYIYFIFFPLSIGLAYFIAQFKYKYLLFLIIIVIFHTSFSFLPIKEYSLDATMPSAEYKEAYAYVKKNFDYKNEIIISTWTPATLWYLGKVDGWLRHSITGRKNEHWINNKQDNKEVFSGKPSIMSTYEFPNKFIIILDYKAKNVIDSSYIQFFQQHCTQKFEAKNIEVYSCER